MSEERGKAAALGSSSGEVEDEPDEESVRVAVTGHAGMGVLGDEEAEVAAERKAVQTWLLVAVACAVASGVFWWNGLGDAAFVAAVLGVVAWFWNQRATYKKIKDENEDGEDYPADEAGDEDGRE